MPGWERMHSKNWKPWLKWMKEGDYCHPIPKWEESINEKVILSVAVLCHLDW